MVNLIDGAGVIKEAYALADTIPAGQKLETVYAFLFAKLIEKQNEVIEDYNEFKQSVLSRRLEDQ